MLAWEIVLLQHSIWEGGFSKNSRKIRELLEKHQFIYSAAKRFLLLPELALRGFPYSKIHDNAFPLDASPDVSFYKTIAQEYRLFLVGSLIEKQDEKIFNTTLMFNPDGKILAAYRKIHLIEQEAKYFVPGKEIVITEIDGIKVGFATCYDLRFPELFRVLALRGARLIFVSGQFPEARIHHWRVLLQARAIENQIFIVGVNRCGSSKILYYPGNSLVVSPFGEIVLEAGEDECLSSVNIDLSEVEKVRSKGYYLRDITSGVIHNLAQEVIKE